MPRLKCYSSLKGYVMLHGHIILWSEGMFFYFMSAARYEDTFITHIDATNKIKKKNNTDFVF